MPEQATTPEVKKQPAEKQAVATAPALPGPPARKPKPVLDEKKLSEIVYRWRDHARRHRRRIKDDTEMMYPAGIVADEMGYLLAEVVNQGAVNQQTKAVAKRLEKFIAYNRGDIRRNSFVSLSPAETSGDFKCLLDVLEEALGRPLVVQTDEDAEDEVRAERPPSSQPVVTISLKDDDESV